MRKKIIGIFVCMLVIVTCVPITGDISEEKKDGYSVPIYQRPHHLSIRMQNVYVKECGDDGTNEPGEYFFYIFVFPKVFHWRTDIYEVDEDPDDPIYLGKLCTASEIKFTPQRIFILAFDDDKNDINPVNPTDFLDWTKIKLSPPKGDYPQTNMYEKMFKWTNIYFTADVVVQFYYVTNTTTG